LKFLCGTLLFHPLCHPFLTDYGPGDIYNLILGLFSFAILIILWTVLVDLLRYRTVAPIETIKEKFVTSVVSYIAGQQMAALRDSIRMILDKISEGARRFRERFQHWVNNGYEQVRLVE
jgi:hypothetical protein